MDFRGIHQPVFIFADAAVSFSGDDYVLGLGLEEFHTFRFESIDGISYRFSVDGLVFSEGSDNEGNESHFLQLGGNGGCDLNIMPRINEWDFVRYGTISYEEAMVSTDPPSGFVDARSYAPLDRFTITYDSPNYAYIDDITVEVSGGDAPAVTQTRRRENDGPETLEIVLDRPISMGETTRFTFNDGEAVKSIEYIFAPGDTDGDGDADLSDFAELQVRFGQSPPTGACLALDLIADSQIGITDYEYFQSLLAGP